ncbi:MAG: hypothetical protein M1834_000207 [Cirrosporium novae-zelandiae]|nr:MAG: hypothetical protein M1834_000207 [Cirrosporium novae-zelandiae]
MKNRLLILATGAVLVASSQAIHLRQRDNPAVVGLDIERKPISNPLARDQRRRKRDTISETLDNEETLYYANITIGTPAQSLRLHIDTGSSDLWTNAANSTLCESRTNPCSSSGTYSANDSSTYDFVSSDFNISYVDGSGAAGDYVKDTVRIGGQALTGAQFGVGYTSTSSEGVLGVGYPALEVQVNTNGKDAYANLPQLMVNKGLINSNAYSLWLNDLDASQGSILFGGVNTGKYHGELATLPINKESNQYIEFLITLTGITLSSNGTTQNLTSDAAINVLLDSGTSLTYLPDAITEEIFDAVSAEYSSSVGAAYVLCSLAENNATIDFTFTEPTISVAMNELVLDAGTSISGERLTFDSGEDACLFGIAPAGSSTAVLGDTFLRSAYVVYDIENDEISLAQTNFNSTTNNVKEITKDSVPGASTVANAVTATASGGSVDATITSIISSSSESGAVSGQIMGSFMAIVVALGAGAALIFS